MTYWQENKHSTTKWTRCLLFLIIEGWLPCLDDPQSYLTVVSSSGEFSRCLQHSACKSRLGLAWGRRRVGVKNTPKQRTPYVQPSTVRERVICGQVTILRKLTPSKCEVKHNRNCVLLVEKRFQC